jgi:hypothetical protein
MERRNRMGERRGAPAAILLAAALGVFGAIPGHAQKGEPMMLPEPTAKPAAPQQTGLPGDSYVAEVVDSTFFVGPAEFFALDLPTKGQGTEATHLSGTVSATGKGDIMVRLFSGIEYDRWLKKRGGPVAKPFWVSSKSRVVNVEQPLPVGQAVVLLLDNGYSIRTPKRVHCQLQIQYRRLGVPISGGAPDQTAPLPKSGDDVVPTPRSNEEQDTLPPPPPPPPDDSGK